MKFKEDTKFEFNRIMNYEDNEFYYSMVYVDSDFFVHIDPSNLNKFNTEEMITHIKIKTIKLISYFFGKAINSFTMIKEM